MRRASCSRPRSTSAQLLGALALAAITLPATAFVLPQPVRTSSVLTRARGLVRATAPPASSSSSSTVDAPATAATTTSKPAFGERTRRILDSIQTQGDATGGAGSSIAFSTLEAMDRAWEAVRTGKAFGEEGQPVPTFVRNVRTCVKQDIEINPLILILASTMYVIQGINPLIPINPTLNTQNQQVDIPLPSAPTFDVVVCGGTLGIFMATALQRKGFKVCVVERGPLQGRAQEWNISRKELRELVEQGVLGEEDMQAAIAIDFNPIRVGFVGVRILWCSGTPLVPLRRRTAH